MPDSQEASATSENASREPRADTVIVAVCVVVIACLSTAILLYGYGRDQGIYAMVGRSLLSGGMPYRDAWDFKPPGIFLLYAAARALFGSSQSGIRVLEVAGLVAMAVVMSRLAAQAWGQWRIGLLGATIAIVIHAQLDFWHTAQPESFGGMLTIFALAVATRRARSKRERALGFVAAGALFGAAGLLKPPLAGGGAVLAAALAFEAYRSASSRRWASAITPVLLVFLGGTASMLACGLWFFARGALPDLVGVLFVFTPHYTALGWETTSVTSMLARGALDFLFEYSHLTALGMGLLFVFRPKKGEWTLVALLVGTLAMQVVGVTMQGKFFPYHYGACWPLAGMLAALGLWKAWARAKAMGVVAMMGLAAVVAAIGMGQSATKHLAEPYSARFAMRARILFGMSDDPTRDKDALATVADVNAAANRAVAEHLRAHTEASRPVFVWGFEPVIYDLADRAPASRFIYDVPQRVMWAAPPMRERLMADLDAAPPAAIVVEHGDVFPSVTGNALDSALALEDFDALRDLLRDRYLFSATIQDFDVYLERAP